MLFLRDIMKSITLLSFFQLVFSKRSANNLYSYLYPRSHSNCHSTSFGIGRFDIGAAFTTFRIPVVNTKLYKCSGGGGGGNSYSNGYGNGNGCINSKSHIAFGRTWNNVNTVLPMPSLSTRSIMTTTAATSTQRNLIQPEIQVAYHNRCHPGWDTIFHFLGANAFSQKFCPKPQEQMQQKP